MQTWYEVTNFSSPQIIERRYKEETEKFLIRLDGKRDAKETKYSKQFPTLEEAEAYKAKLDAERADALRLRHARKAAPDLLDVLEELFERGPVSIALAGNPNACEALEAKARAAIAKAKGEVA